MKMADDVGGGVSFSQALASFPNLFSQFYINIVRSGEASGTLSSSLTYLADYLENQYNFSRKIIGAMTYPIFILFVMLAVVFLMLFFVVPQLFVSMHVLPCTPSTQLYHSEQLQCSLHFFFITALPPPPPPPPPPPFPPGGAIVAVTLA